MHAFTGAVSGGHLNPAVSLMFFTFRQITIVKFFLYTLVQTAGAFFGAALAYVVYWGKWIYTAQQGGTLN